jgi:hypothetical protein
MQSRQYRRGDDTVAGSKAMPVWTHELLWWHGNAWAEPGVWSPVVVVKHPLSQDEAKMPFIQHNQPIQASRRIVPISRSQKAFACGHCTGVFSTIRPIAVTAASTAGA